jgi:hypothetical protein
LCVFRSITAAIFVPFSSVKNCIPPTATPCILLSPTYCAGFPVNSQPSHTSWSPASLLAGVSISPLRCGIRAPTPLVCHSAAQRRNLLFCCPRNSCQPPKTVQKRSTTHHLKEIKLPSAWQMSFTQSRILKVVSRNKEKTRPTAGPLHLTGQLTSRPTRAANRARFVCATAEPHNLNRITILPVTPISRRTWVSPFVLTNLQPKN